MNERFVCDRIVETVDMQEYTKWRMLKSATAFLPFILLLLMLLLGIIYCDFSIPSVIAAAVLAAGYYPVRFIQWSHYKKTTDLEFEARRNVMGGPSHNVTVFTDNEIVDETVWNEQNRRRVILPYDRIGYVISLREHTYLFSTSGMIVIIHNGSFRKESRSALISFLREKGIRVHKQRD